MQEDAYLGGCSRDECRGENMRDDLKQGAAVVLQQDRVMARRYIVPGCFRQIGTILEEKGPS